ncbi:MAG: DUF4397 domain-containing protein [Candidatus Delongbacteria bacterium]
MNRSMFGLLLLAGLAGGVEAAADLRVAHLSPDAPAVDVWLDNSVALSGVACPAFSPYLEVPAGPHRVRVFATGTNQNPVIDATLPFVDGQALTVAATGLLADGSFGPVVIPDTREVSPTQAWVRFSHSAADAPAVDITLPDGTVLFGDVVFNESTGYLPVAPGSYDLQVRLAGSSTVVLAFQPVALSAGTTLSVFATGTLAAGTLGALAAVDAPGDGSTFLTLESAGTHLRVAHLSPDAPAVDVWLDGAAVLTGVLYPAFSPYLDIPGGSHHVQVYVAGTNQNPVIDATLDFTPGSVTTVAATGLLGDGSFGPLVLTDTRQTSPTEAWVRFVHAAGDAPAVDITLPDGTVLFGDVVFNESLAYLPVAPGSYGLQVRLAGSSTVVLNFLPVELSAGTTLSVFATGSLAAGTLGALVAIDSPGDGSQTLWLEQASAVVAGGGRPLGLELGSAYPNPFNPRTTLGFRLDRAQQVRLSVYNSLGQTVAVLQDGLLGAGEHARSWDAAGVPSGLYYAQLEGQGLSQVRALTLIK